MSQTRAQLVARVLKLLGVLAAGQAPSAEDYVAVDDEINTVLAGLRARGVIDVADSDEIEDEVFQPLARVIACHNASDFGVNAISGYPGMPMDAVRYSAEGELRAMQSPTATREPITFLSY